MSSASPSASTLSGLSSASEGAASVSVIGGGLCASDSSTTPTSGAGLALVVGGTLESVRPGVLSSDGQPSSVRHTKRMTERQAEVS